MPAPPNGRVLRFDPSAAGNLVGWWSASSAEAFISTGATRVRDLSGNNRPMVAVTPGTAAGYLGWAPDPVCGGIPSLSQDLSTATVTGLGAAIPSLSAPLSVYLVAYLVTGAPSTADVLGFNTALSGGPSTQTDRLFAAGTSWSVRVANSANAMNASGVAQGVAHVMCFTNDVSGATCFFFVDDPYTAKASVVAASTNSGFTDFFMLSNLGGSTDHGGRVFDVLLYSGIHDAGTRFNTMRWLASRNRLPLQRLFGGY